MFIRKILPYTYILAVGFFFLAIYSFLTDKTDVVSFLLVNLAAQIVFVALVFYELRQYKLLPEIKRSFLTALLISVPIIGGIFYFTAIRGKIIYNKQN